MVLTLFQQGLFNDIKIFLGNITSQTPLNLDLNNFQSMKRLVVYIVLELDYFLIRRIYLVS